MALAFALAACPLAAAFGQAAEAVAVQAQPFDRFQIGRASEQYGAFSFVGGLNLLSGDRRFAGLSGFRFLDKQGVRFAAISDYGYYLQGNIERNADGVPMGFGNVEIAQLTDAAGATNSGKGLVDAEGLAIDADGRVLVSYERRHRIAAYKVVAGVPRLEPDRFDYLIPDYEIRSNKGIEALLVSGKASVLAGALVAITEKSINPAGDIFASVLSGPRKGIFFIKRRDEFDITDGVALPSGDLLILERRFNFSQGIAMRLRKISAKAIKPNATVDGPIVLAADFAFQIDNMEGMDVWRDGQGRLRIGFISDDNRSFLQRSLYLEFIIDEAKL